MKELVKKMSDLLGYDNVEIVDLLYKLKTEKSAWIVVTPFQEFYQTSMYFKWNAADTRWIESGKSHHRERLFTTEEAALKEALEHLFTCSFFMNNIRIEDIEDVHINYGVKTEQ